ncbi:MAG: LysR family transcriptional regulator [Solobacterium sp.]|nr:LysR family transcriptional regulator [Solobacterium sp.]
MELRDLRYFMETAVEGNMSRAAEKLPVSQPVISKQLMELEEELGVILFTRTNYGIRLTEEGLLLREKAADILALSDQTEALFKNSDDLSAGNIYIGLAEARSMIRIAEVMFTLRQKHPGILCNTFSGNLSELSERLDKGLLEFAVVSNYVDQNRYNFLTLPDKEHWGILAKKGDPLTEKVSLSVEDLFTLPLICSVQWLDLDVPLWIRDQRKLNITATYTLFYNAAVLVRAGLGYAVVYDGLIDKDNDSDLTFIPLCDAPEQSMFIIWRKNRTFTPAASAFLQELLDHFG